VKGGEAGEGLWRAGLGIREYMSDSRYPGEGRGGERDKSGECSQRDKWDSEKCILTDQAWVVN